MSSGPSAFRTSQSIFCGRIRPELSSLAKVDSSILSKKLKLKEVIVFDDFSKEIKKTKEMDKILIQAQNFYQETATHEGRCRFPGQDKYNMAVGVYTSELELIDDIQLFETLVKRYLGP